MNLPTPDEIEKKTLLILRVLRDARQPLGARLIARRMADHGVSMSERTIRYHLRLMDERGLTKLVGRRDGRVVTQSGLDELSSARVRDKLGMAISRIEILAFKTTFDPKKRQGLLPVNLSFFPRKVFGDALEAMKPAFREGLCVSDRVSVAGAGEKFGDVVVPEGRIGLATVCSIVVNGVLLKNGIPMDSKFGGILQMSKGKPLRFVELIYYSGSSLDPSEAFIQARMTSVGDVAQRGDGRILANFREIPAPSRGLVEVILSDFRKAGIEGVLSMGETSEPICEVPVDLNKIGLILIGGLNPICCAREAGIESENKAMSTVMAYEELLPFRTVLTTGGR